jgi:hypothetical protein
MMAQLLRNLGDKRMNLTDAIAGLSLRDIRRAADAWGVEVLRRDDVDEYRRQITSNQAEILQPKPVERYLDLSGLPYHVQVMAKTALRRLLNEPLYLAEVGAFHEALIEAERAFLDYAASPKALKHLSSEKIELYKAVLAAAWQDVNINASEIRLLEVLRSKLEITRRDHRVIEVQLGRFPSTTGKAHTVPEIEEAIRHLSHRGLILDVRMPTGARAYCIPDELGDAIRSAMDIELKGPNFEALMAKVPVRVLREALDQSDQAFAGNREFLSARILDGYVSPRTVLRLLKEEELADLMKGLPGIKEEGSKEVKVRNVVRYFDRLEIGAVAGPGTIDMTELLVKYYRDLASRSYDVLRAAGVIAKDKDVDLGFERATRHLFQVHLGLSIDSFDGTNHPDGRVALEDPYRVLLWDCKSCEGQYALTDRLARQFLAYATSTAPKVASPLLVIAPGYSPDSVDAVMRLKVLCPPGTEIALITADDLLWLADLWAKRRSQGGAGSLPWQVLATTGLLDRQVLQKRLRSFA